LSVKVRKNPEIKRGRRGEMGTEEIHTLISKKRGTRARGGARPRREKKEENGRARKITGFPTGKRKNTNKEDSSLIAV